MNDLKYQLENRNFGWKDRTESMVLNKRCF